MKQANDNIWDENMSKDRFIDTMFEIVFLTNIVSMFDNNMRHQIDAPILRLNKAFTRHFVGELSLYSKYSSISFDIVENEGKIISLFSEQLDITNYASKLDAISCIHNKYEKTINPFKDNNILWLDDAFNFRKFSIIWTYDQTLQMKFFHQQHI